MPVDPTGFHLCLGHLFVTSSSSRSFNKNDFEQYLFKNGFSSILERTLFFSTNQPDCFGIGATNDAAVRLVKFGSDYNEILKQMNNNDKAYFMF